MLVWVSHRVFWMAGWVYKPPPAPQHMSLEATCLCRPSRMHMQRGPTASASLLFTLEGTDRQPFIMRSFFLLLVSLLLVSHGSSAVITGVSGSKQVHTSWGIMKLVQWWEHAGQVFSCFKNCCFLKRKCALLNTFFGLNDKIFNIGYTIKNAWCCGMKLISSVA